VPIYPNRKFCSHSTLSCSLSITYKWLILLIMMRVTLLLKEIVTFVGLILVVMIIVVRV